jgi:hypothetical protein
MDNYVKMYTLGGVKMKKKQKVIFIGSIIFNVVLFMIVLWGYISTNFANDQLFFTEVQGNLVGLEGLIVDQKEKNWTDPNLVTTKLGEIVNGLDLGLSNGRYLFTISYEDLQTLGRLESKLRQYPQDELYRFTSLSENDKENFEELQIILREVELGQRFTILNNWDSFIHKINALEGKIDVLIE